MRHDAHIDKRSFSDLCAGLDPRTGRRAPDSAYAFDVNIRDVGEVGTIKYVWEPSRHYQLTVLAAAYLLTEDARYASFVAAQLRSW